MPDRDERETACKAAEIRMMICCDLFGPMETMRILGYAQALRENCKALLAAGKSRKTS